MSYFNVDFKKMKVVFSEVDDGRTCVHAEYDVTGVPGYEWITAKPPLLMSRKYASPKALPREVIPMSSKCVYDIITDLDQISMKIQEQKDRAGAD